MLSIELQTAQAQKYDASQVFVRHALFGNRMIQLLFIKDNIGNFLSCTKNNTRNSRRQKRRERNSNFNPEK
jgi:hypothetical protein